MSTEYVDFVETQPAPMSPEQLRRHAETMERFRAIELHARISFRLMLGLIAVFVLGCWQGWM